MQIRRILILTATVFAYACASSSPPSNADGEVGGSKSGASNSHDGNEAGLGGTTSAGNETAGYGGGTAAQAGGALAIGGGSNAAGGSSAPGGVKGMGGKGGSTAAGVGGTTGEAAGGAPLGAGGKPAGAGGAFGTTDAGSASGKGGAGTSGAQGTGGSSSSTSECVPAQNPGKDGMNPGQACLSCHASQPANRRWTVAGNIFDSVDGTKPVPGATITIVDANQVTTTLVTGSDGAFFTNKSVAFPLTVAASKCPDTKKMPTSPSSGDCNSCHKAGNRIHLP